MSETTIQKFNSEFLSAMEKTEFLTDSEKETLERCLPEIKHTFECVQVHRTKAERDISVLNDVKHPTPDAKYWQSKREMDVFVSSLWVLNYDYEEKLCDLTDLLLSLEEVSHEPQTPRNVNLSRRLSKQVEKTRFELLVMRREAHHRVREIAMWEEAIASLKKDLLFSPDDPSEHQYLSYPVRYSLEMMANAKAGSTLSYAEARNAVGLLKTSFRMLSEAGYEDRFRDAISRYDGLAGYLAEEGVL